MHVRVEPQPLPVAAGHQMQAIAGRALAAQYGNQWRFGDSHWLHPVRRISYNLFCKNRKSPEPQK
jgi:hypothetical protein